MFNQQTQQGAFAPNPMYYGNVNSYGQVPNPQQPPRVSNWLTPEKIALLKKGVEQFNLSVSDEDVARGQCNHIDNATGMPALIPDIDGSGGYTCQICGTHFVSRDYTPEEVKQATDFILDILNTIKITYLSLDPNAAMDYFQIIPFIEKVPKLFEVAANDFKKYEGLSGFRPNGNSLNPFAAFGMMMTPGFGNQMNMGGYQQPYGAYPQGQPIPPQPMNAGFAQQNPAFNPMYGQYYGQPATAPTGFYPNQQPAPAGYQPQTQGFAMNPQGAAAPQPVQNTNMPQQPVAPAATTPEPTKGEVKVDTQFKK